MVIKPMNNVMTHSKQKVPGEGICAAGLRYSPKRQNYQDDLLISLRFKQTQFCTQATQA